MTSTAIVWYRRDLRLHDHPALRAALDAFDRVVSLFVLDDAPLHGRYRSGGRTAFMLGCLRALDGELHVAEADSWCATGAPSTSCPRWPPTSAPAPCCGRATSRRTRGRATRA